MSRAEEFEGLQPLLFAIARRVLGEGARAEHAVGEARRRWETAPPQLATTKGFLVAAVTRTAVDALRTAGGRPDEQIGDALLTAALLLIDELSPLEGALFVLRVVFGCGFPEIASALGCSERACRRLADAVCAAGGGEGTAPPWPRHIAGAENVALAVTAIARPLLLVGITLEEHQVGDRPGAILRDRSGRVLDARVLLDIADGRIQTIHWGSARAPDPDSA